MTMDSRMMASFVNELQKIAESNAVNPTKPDVGGMGSNIMGKPLPSPGISAGMSGAKPQAAKTTNYSMVHSNTPMVAFNAGASSKMLSPPPVKT